MFEFICRVYVLLAGVFGTKETRKRIMYSWSYGMSWQKIAKKIWNKEDGITTMKPSGTVSTLSKEGSGIHPPYGQSIREREIILVLAGTQRLSDDNQTYVDADGNYIRPACKWLRGCADRTKCYPVKKCLGLDPINRKE